MTDTLRKLAALFPATDRRDAALLFVMMLLATALEALTIGSVYLLIATLMDPVNPDRLLMLLNLHRFLGSPEPQRFLVFILLTVFIAYLVKNTYGAAIAYLQNRFAFNKQTALARRLFEHYLGQPYTFHMQRNSAQLIRNLASEADQVIWAVFLPGVVLIAESLVAVTLIVVLFVVDPLSALIILLIFGSVGASYYLLLRKRITRWGEERQHHEGQRILRIQQGLGGIKEVKVLGREQYFLDAFMHHSNARARSFTRYQLSSAMPLLILEVIGIASLLMVVVIALALERQVAGVLPFLGMVAAAAFRLIPASNRILITFQQLRYGRPIVEALYREFNSAAGVARIAPANNEPLVFKQMLRLENIAFRYPGREHDVFSGVTLELARGQSIAIVGPSGAGKSTLVDIILGLLVPKAGHVSIDGRDLQTIIRPWQSKIGYIPQHIYLIDDSLRRNIAFGIPDAAIDETALERAISRAQLQELVASLPAGLKTPVGERGVRLSGGQLQRVGIARALYHEPEVLILDEATSSLDTRTESDVMEAIEKLRGEKTILIIAHRLSSVENCDLTLRVENGTVQVQEKPQPKSALAAPVQSS